MKKQTVTLTGYIRNELSKAGLPNLRVEAWDRDIRIDDIAGNGVTDKNGRFNIIMNQKNGGWNFTDQKADIYFKIYEGDRMVHNTFDSVMWDLTSDKKDIEILINMENIMTNQNGNQKGNIVFGRITESQNLPLAKLIVRVNDKDLRSEVLLAETITDKEGKYEIAWQQIQLTGKNRKTADISIKVLTPEKKTVLFNSDINSIRFNASQREEINITIQGVIKPEVVEYDELLREVTYLAGRVAITDLKETKEQPDITFLSKELEMKAEKIEYLVVAHRLQALSQIDAAFFYALFHENTLLKNDFSKLMNVRLSIGINSDLQGLLYDAALADPKKIQKDVTAAVKEMIVASNVSKECKRNIALLQKYKAPAEEYYKNELPKKVLDTISGFISGNKIQEIGKLFSEHKHDLNTFFEKITDPSFFSSKAGAANAETSIALGQLLGFGNGIVPHVIKSKKITKPGDIKKLAKLNKAAWVEELTKAKGKKALNAVDKNEINLSASLLARKLEREFPTMAFTAQLEREKKPVLKNQEKIVSFLNKHEDFDLTKDNVDLFLKNNKVIKKKDEAMGEELKTMQRIFKLVPNYSKTNALLKENIHSSQRITAIGETRFVKEIAPKAGIDSKEAKVIFKKAESINTAAMLIVGQLQSSIRSMDIASFETASFAKKLKTVSKDFPNLKTLFKLTDVCECQHCRSVYSPSAYLVEILQFLDKRSVTDLSTGDQGYAKLRLFDRRPDLGEIDLSCENANTPVKYIDLVCELLEEAIAPDQGISFTGVLSDSSDPLKGKISNGLLTVLKAEGIPVTEDAMIFHSEVVTGSTSSKPHYLRDKKVVCRIETGSGTYKVFRLRQTLSSAEELAAAPEYVNKDAYNKLQNNSFAFKLPFELNHVEAKAYFDRFGVDRSDLMKTFQVANVPAEESIAAEVLGLTDAERILVVTPDTANQQKYWNTTSVNAMDEMKSVGTFLTKSGISYKELDLLLKLNFIANSDNLYIKHLDLSCDTGKKEIANLTEICLDRIHRFLRLQKKTGWSFEVLDEIISQTGLGAGILDDACLIICADLQKLSIETGIMISELIGFYGDIPYEIIQEDAPKPLYNRVFLNKAKNGFIDDGLLPEMVLDNENKIANPTFNPPGWVSIKVSGFKTIICTCLQISERDLNNLLPSPTADLELTFANLSYLFAASRLIKKLKLKTDEFIILKELTGLNVFQNPQETLDFIKTVEDFKKSPLKAAEVKYMLRHKGVNLPNIDVKIKQILDKLQKDYQNNFAINKSKFNDKLSAQEQKETIQSELSKLNGIGEVDVKNFIKIIDNEWTLLNDAQNVISTIYTPPDQLTINNSINALEAVIGPNYGLEKNNLINLLCSTIDITFVPTGLSEIQRINKLQNLLTGVLNITDSEVNSIMNYIELGNEKRFVDNKLGSLLNTNLIKTKIDELKNGTATDKDLIKAFLDSIAPYQLATGKQTILEQSISTSFKSDPELVKIVLKYAELKQPAPGGGLLSTILLSDSLIDTDISHAVPILPSISDIIPFINHYASMRLLNKLLPLINAFKLSNNEIAWYFENNRILGWFEWDSIPYSNDVVQVAIDFYKYLAFVGMIELANQFPPIINPADAEDSISFLNIASMLLQGSTTTRTQFETGMLPVFIEKFSILTGYEKNSLLDIDKHFFPTVLNLDNYRNIKNLLRLFDCSDYFKKLGADKLQVAKYIQPVLQSDDVSTLRAALKLRYDEETWLSTLKEIMDVIRPQKRNALVAYLLATKPEMKDENDLYDYFLVDVEMESCMPSSRIVLAHSVVQLFVQRCLMGLEQMAVADLDNDPNWSQWKWMKNYRVWEANRKVFLYPENWLEPDLRDNKSFLFREFENEIQQNELTDFTSGEALIKYLEKLDGISFLEVMATWYQTDIRTMHVFGRTKGGDPAIYYYRRFEQERYWTPWEKVELDITGDHLLAFVRNNRLCLAWPFFTEEPNPDQIPEASDGVYDKKAQRKLKIQLAISEFANGTWQPKKISKEGILTPDEYTSVEDDLKRDKFNLMYVEATEQVWLFYSDIAFNMFKDSFKKIIQIEDHNVRGVFNLTGCKGYPELSLEKNPKLNDFLPDFKDAQLKSQRYNELNKIPLDDLSVKNGVTISNFIELLKTTPGKFRITYPHQFTGIDLISLIYQMLTSCFSSGHLLFRSPLGTLLPYFMEDSNHAYVLIPGFYKMEMNLKGGDIFTDVEKRTSSEVFQLIDDIKALYIKFMVTYKQNFLEFIKGDEFKSFLQDISIYSQLKYGEQFKNMYHPLVCALRATLYKKGIPELMKRETQLQRTNFDFKKFYSPNPLSVAQTIIPNEDGTVVNTDGTKPWSYPIEDLDFSSDGSYSGYNWELFFHVPFLLATRLTKNQRFEEAMTWFHYMFNPTGALSGSTPQKYWVTKPFYQNQDSDYESQRIDSLLYRIANQSTPEIKELEFAVEQWRKHPFKPDAVARFRPVAYQKAVIMKYIDNLIEWGDYLFRQDTMESIAQATQMYILGDKLLGPKPRIIPPLVKPPYETYNQVEARIDSFGNALIDLENIIPDLTALPEDGNELPTPIPVTLSMLYFCIPQNDKMLEYWDRIADRLFKIRNCQNIEGVERSLALFAPTIDPGMLVRAAASGLDISSVLAGINAPTPYYRFNVLSQKATELAQEVRGLGSSLLQALEKKDAEAMSLMRSEMEMKVLNAVKDMKLLQIMESKEQIEILKRTRKVTEEREKYYAGIKNISTKEQLNLDKLGEAHGLQITSQIVRTLASVLALLPEIDAGASGLMASPVFKIRWGGANLSRATNAAADVINIISSISSYEASRAATLGGYERRFDDWKLQERTANLELKSIEKQLVAAEIRKEIAETDLKNHELQIDNAKKTDEFMRSKFTNKELYDWMIGQTSSVYFSAYQLSHDFAKKAERSYRFELGSDDTFISYGYWDSMKKGLQSADHLIHDIKRMETSYLDKNKREYEITKHVSLSMLDPLALVRLRATGVCDFDIPEVLYDMDHPGHYFRRIKSVSMSIPCIAGPYTSVSAKLSLVNNRYRKNTNSLDEYAEDPGNDNRFVYNVGSIQSIAGSTGQNDSGVFELNFRDERYLPFENTGAISSWRLELPAEVRQFDYDTIADVIVHVKYTAREGGSGLKNESNKVLMDQLAVIKQGLIQEGLHIAINMKHDLPNEWHLLKNNGSVDLKIDKSRLPYMAQTIETTAIESVMFIAKSSTMPPSVSITAIPNPSGISDTDALSKVTEWGEMMDGKSIWKKQKNFITLGNAFNISLIQSQTTDTLDELMMIVKFSF